VKCFFDIFKGIFLDKSYSELTGYVGGADALRRIPYTAQAILKSAGLDLEGIHRLGEAKTKTINGREWVTQEFQLANSDTFTVTNTVGTPHDKTDLSIALPNRRVGETVTSYNVGLTGMANDRPTLRTLARSNDEGKGYLRYHPDSREAGLTMSAMETNLTTGVEYNNASRLVPPLLAAAPNAELQALHRKMAAGAAEVVRGTPAPPMAATLAGTDNVTAQRAPLAPVPGGP
jgi:hypothetical protein